jgi:hypothetical protein
MTAPESVAEAREVDPEAAWAALKKTEYKYFGDYEFSPDQREAVDTLVAYAEQQLSTAAHYADIIKAAERAAEVMEWLDENEPDCFGWTGPYPSKRPAIGAEAKLLRAALEQSK